MGLAPNAPAVVIGDLDEAKLRLLRNWRSIAWAKIQLGRGREEWVAEGAGNQQGNRSSHQRLRNGRNRCRATSFAEDEEDALPAPNDSKPPVYPKLGDLWLLGEPPSTLRRRPRAGRATRDFLTANARAWCSPIRRGI